MRKNGGSKRAPLDSALSSLQPDKVGWIRKFCGRGIFREIWRNRYVVLRGDQLLLAEKEVRDDRKWQEVVDLCDYERSEEIRKSKSRSKKNHSKFTLLRSKTPGNTVPNLVFLAVSPEEKESWISAINGAITRAKNSVLDEVTVEGDSQLSHLTRDRVRIPQPRRLPTRGHLMAVASSCSSDGVLTLDLVQEDLVKEDLVKEDLVQEDLDRSPQADPPHLVDCPRSRTDCCLSTRTTATSEASGKSQSLPREVVGTPWSPQPYRALSNSSVVQIPTAASSSQDPASTAVPVGELQQLIEQKLRRTQELLQEARGVGQAQGLLQEAQTTWTQARQVLRELTEVQVLYRQLPSSSTKRNHRKSIM